MIAVEIERPVPFSEPASSRGTKGAAKINQLRPGMRGSDCCNHHASFQEVGGSILRRDAGLEPRAEFPRRPASTRRGQTSWLSMR